MMVAQACECVRLRRTDAPGRGSPDTRSNVIHPTRYLVLRTLRECTTWKTFAGQQSDHASLMEAPCRWYVLGEEERSTLSRITILHDTLRFGFDTSIR